MGRKEEERERMQKWNWLSAGAYTAQMQGFSVVRRNGIWRRLAERAPNVVSRLTDYLGTPLHCIPLHFSSTKGSDSAYLLIKHMDVIEVRTPISNEGAGILKE